MSFAFQEERRVIANIASPDVLRDLEMSGLMIDEMIFFLVRVVSVT